MIDNFALLVSHALIMIAAWRLLWRPDLNDDSAAPTAEAPRWTRRKDRKGA